MAKVTTTKHGIKSGNKLTIDLNIMYFRLPEGKSQNAATVKTFRLSTVPMPLITFNSSAHIIHTIILIERKRKTERDELRSLYSYAMYALQEHKSNFHLVRMRGQI